MSRRRLTIALLALMAASPLRAETLKVGVTATGVPFTFLDTATQKTAGAMVDLAAAVAEAAGLSPQFDVVAFSALIPSLTTSKIDMISAGMLVTEKRREIVAFSSPVYHYGEALIVPTSETKEITLQDLKGAMVGAQVGTTFADALKQTGLFSEVKLYDSIADILREVRLGRIKAGFGDAPIVTYQLSKNPDLGVRMVKGYKPLVEGELALAIRKDDPALLAKVNAAIATLKAKGKLKEIFGKYGLNL